MSVKVLLEFSHQYHKAHEKVPSERTACILNALKTFI